MSGVFISYRRSDSSWFARSLFDALRAAFPGHSIFIDVEGIDAGLDFVDVINERLSSCEVLLTIIGRRWLEETAPDGSRRIDDPNDNVRAEIEAALQRKIRVIPVLVDGAQIPSQEDLPDSLASLSRRNGLEITHARFSSDTMRLVDVLSSILSSEPRNAEPRNAAKARREPRVRADEPRKTGPWRWLVAGSAALIPVVALSAVLVSRVWPTPSRSEGSVASTTTPSTLVPAAVAASMSADPSIKTGRSTATTSSPPAPEASVPYIFPNTYGPEKTLTALASSEPETVQPDPGTTSADPAPFKSLPKIDVVDKVDLDTDRASARLRLETDKMVSRWAQCESLTVHAEFGSYSMVDGSKKRRQAAKGEGCFFKTSWKDDQAGTVADNMKDLRPRVLNQTLQLLCPSAYENMVKDCQAY